MSAIPNVFQFVFGLREQAEPFHLVHYLCLASCRAVNQPDQIHFHYQHEPWGEWWDRIRPFLTLRKIAPERFVADYSYTDPLVARYRYAHLADFARLRILCEEGGFYADMDTLFLRPVPPSWRDSRFILGEERPPAGAPGGSLCNAWMASAPGAPFGQAWLEGIQAAFDGTWSNHSTLLPYRLSRSMPTEIDVQPSSAFYALDWTRRGLADLFLRSVELPPEALSLHLWSHLWFEPERRDFLQFHGGLLTPDYVAHAPTTYARAARRFMPDDCQTSAERYRRAAARLAWRHPIDWLRSLQR